MIRSQLLWALPVAAIIFACGGKTTLDGAESTSGDPGPPGGGSGTGSDPGGGGGSGFGSDPGSGGSGGAGGSSGSNPGGSSGTGGTSGTSGGTSGKLPPPPPPPALIACGGDKCDAASEECCISFGGGGLGGQTCSPKGKCQGVALSCSSAVSCPKGLVCCAGYNGGSPGAECKSSCGGGGGGGGGGGFGGIQLCESNAECPPGFMCRNTPIGLKICAPPFGPGGFGGP